MRKLNVYIYKRPEESSACELVMVDELPYQTLIMDRLSALGVIDIKDNKLPVDQIDRVAKIVRLRRSLGVNLTGVVIICELLDRLDSMEDEIKRQRSVYMDDGKTR